MRAEGVEQANNGIGNLGSGEVEKGAASEGACGEPASNTPTVTRKQLIRLFVAWLEAIEDVSRKHEFEVAFSGWIDQIVMQQMPLSKYRILFLYADRTLSHSDADRIYRALTNSAKAKRENEKPVLLILHSPGGYASSAYMIGKMLHEFSPAGVEIAVPRKAKSAATLLCCSANHVHMGSLSQLGPIDPQLEDGPALGLKASIEHLARLATEYPNATPLFVGYMSERIDPISLGYCERAAESAMQYAERLLKSAHHSCAQEDVEAIARRLTYDYKDHGFVIDKHEAASLFPNGTVVFDAEEYFLADSLYQDIRVLERIARLKNFTFSFVGSVFDHPCVTSTR